MRTTDLKTNATFSNVARQMSNIFSPCSARRGAIAIPLLASLALLIITIGLSINSVSYNESQNYGNIADSYKALEYAESGARDALQRIAINYAATTSGGSDCGSLNSGGAAPCYTMDFTSDSAGCLSANNGCARVKITKPATSTCPSATCSLITSEGRVGSFIRKIQVTVTLSTNANYTNMIKDTVWLEI